MPLLILASNSPRRRQLLALGGWMFGLDIADVDETRLTAEAPADYVRRLAEAKARAVLEGRLHVSCNDVKRSAIPVLRHRIYTNFTADSDGLTSVTLVNKLLESVEEPSEKDYQKSK